jgi:hypothetical protein
MTISTDFSRFFYDYVKHTPLQLTSAGFSMTISNTPIVLVEEVCAWHSHGNIFWSPSKRCVLNIVMEKPAEVSQDDGCVWYSHGKTCWNQSKRCVLDIVMEKPAEVSQAGFYMTISNTLISSTDFSRFFHGYVKHTHRLDWLQQVFPWLY